MMLTTTDTLADQNLKYLDQLTLWLILKAQSAFAYTYIDNKEGRTKHLHFFPPLHSTTNGYQNIYKDIT